MFGLRHSGLQGQKVTTAVTWIHQNLGLETDSQTKFKSLNYSDDIGGAEETYIRALQSFKVLGELLADLGLKESSQKAHPPSTKCCSSVWNLIQLYVYASRSGEAVRG